MIRRIPPMKRWGQERFPIVHQQYHLMCQYLKLYGHRVEESQYQLHSAEAELDRMKQYLNEALEEFANFKKRKNAI